jgi:flagellar biosynthesis/type III secretory pathway M-ring protein FliF/YscJ
MIEDTILEISKNGAPVTIVLIALYAIVRYLIEKQSERDKQTIAFIERQEMNFKNTIDNHLDAQKKSMDNLTAVTDQQNKVNRELLEYLKKCNGK